MKAIVKKLRKIVRYVAHKITQPAIREESSCIAIEPVLTSHHQCPLNAGCREFSLLFRTCEAGSHPESLGMIQCGAETVMPVLMAGTLACDALLACCMALHTAVPFT